MEAWEVLGLWLSVGIFFSGFSSVYQITLKVWLGLSKPIISRLQLLVSGERKKLPLARVSTFRSILMKQDTVLECNTDQLARFTRLRSYHEWIKWFTFPPREVHILQSSYGLLLGNAWSNLATNRTPRVPTLYRLWLHSFGPPLKPTRYCKKLKKTAWLNIRGHDTAPFLINTQINFTVWSFLFMYQAILLTYSNYFTKLMTVLFTFPDFVLELLSN